MNQAEHVTNIVNGKSLDRSGAGSGSETGMPCSHSRAGRCIKRSLLKQPPCFVSCFIGPLPGSTCLDCLVGHAGETSGHEAYLQAALERSCCDLVPGHAGNDVRTTWHVHRSANTACGFRSIYFSRAARHALSCRPVCTPECRRACAIEPTRRTIHAQCQIVLSRYFTFEK